MKKPEAPCFKCQDRRPGCHGSCGKFLDYENIRNDYNYKIIINRRRNRPAVLTEYIYEGQTAYYKNKDHQHGKGKCIQ